MIPARFEYAAPTTVAEACRLLATTPGAKVLAGGMSLIPALKPRLSQPSLLVDIGRIQQLSGVSKSWGKLHIGACTTHAELVDHPELPDFPAFSDTARVIGDPQVRNRGTIGGSLAYADPAADWPALFLALEGEAGLVGARGKRKVKAEDFFLRMLSSDIGADELLTEIIIPAATKRSGAAYCKLRHQASGLAVVGVAARLTMDRKGRISEATIGVTGVNTIAFRARSIEPLLVGVEPGRESFERICADIAEADPMEDRLAPPDYRRQLLKVQTLKALETAVARSRSN
ncbi:MAG: xanthine dehydrogenase family protein subunit M [Pseudomonadales bacterium]|nr:xanthine dehydrogenase family protein subunit M [Pseudomonadales bacterium]